MKYIFWTLLVLAGTVAVTISHFRYVGYGWIIASALSFIFTILYNIQSRKSDNITGTDEPRVLPSILLPILSAAIVVIPMYINLDTVGFKLLH